MSDAVKKFIDECDARADKHRVESEKDYYDALFKIRLALYKVSEDRYREAVQEVFDIGLALVKAVESGVVVFKEKESLTSDARDVLTITIDRVSGDPDGTGQYDIRVFKAGYGGQVEFSGKDYDHLSRLLRELVKSSELTERKIASGELPENHDWPYGFETMGVARK